MFEKENRLTSANSGFYQIFIEIIFCNTVYLTRYILSCGLSTKIYLSNFSYSYDIIAIQILHSTLLP